MSSYLLRQLLPTVTPIFYTVIKTTTKLYTDKDSTFLFPSLIIYNYLWTSEVFSSDRKEVKFSMLQMLSKDFLYSIFHIYPHYYYPVLTGTQLPETPTQSLCRFQEIW